MKPLTSIQLDTLTEILNIGIGRAAHSLNEIIGQHITLRVPNVEILPKDEMIGKISELGEMSFSSVFQDFSGDFNGTALLLFPPESAVRLVQSLTGTDPTLEELDTLQMGTLMEVGNIIINAILGTMSNLLKCRLTFMIPEFRGNDPVETLTSSFLQSDMEGYFMLARAFFDIQALEIAGYILITFEIDSLDHIKNLIDVHLKG